MDPSRLTTSRLARQLLRAAGLAGLAGVAATGVLLARDERRRRALTPDEVRERLHDRLDAAGRAPDAPPEAD